MESKAEIITKRELECWQNVENIEEIPPEALRAMYLDLKENSVPRQKIENKIKIIEMEEHYDFRTNYTSEQVEELLQELLEKS